MAILTEQKLDFWLKNNLNVLLKGKAGTGKTAMIKDCFERNKVKWVYFSAATMDPWVDFIGIPTKEKDANSGKEYIEFVRPKAFAEDEVEFIFCDEFNRGSKKIRNALMELIQFKSINGKKFHKLRAVWAAINPPLQDGEEGVDYDVEELDPAQLDRFQIQIDVPYKPDKKYFIQKYQEKGETACQWWSNLDNPLKNQISPRRLEYVLQLFNMGGDVVDVLPQQVNASQLITQLASGSFLKLMENCFQTKDLEKSKELFKDPNFFEGVKEAILKNEQKLKFFYPAMPEEIFSKVFSMSGTLQSIILKNKEELKKNQEFLNNLIIKGNSVKSKSLIKDITEALATLDAQFEYKLLDDLKSFFIPTHGHKLDVLPNSNDRLKLLRSAQLIMTKEAGKLNDPLYQKDLEGLFIALCAVLSRSTAVGIHNETQLRMRELQNFGLDLKSTFESVVRVNKSYKNCLNYGGSDQRVLNSINVLIPNKTANTMPVTPTT